MQTEAKVISGMVFYTGKSTRLYKPFLLLAFFLLFFKVNTFAQIYDPRLGDENLFLARAIVIDGDTFLYNTLPVFVLLSPKEFNSRRERVRYNRLMRNVMRVYPYARLAGMKLRQYNDLLLNVTSEREKRQIMRRVEDELEAQFGNELKKLTFTQGVILLKLLDRETGHTGYELLSDLRGTFRAFFWQGIGRLFGYNLRIKYDPNGRDKDIEDIVLRIKYGQL